MPPAPPFKNWCKMADKLEAQHVFWGHGSDKNTKKTRGLGPWEQQKLGKTRVLGGLRRSWRPILELGSLGMAILRPGACPRSQIGRFWGRWSTVLEVMLGLFWLNFGIKNATWNWLRLRNDFCLILGPLERSKIELPCRREANFDKFEHCSFGLRFWPILGSKIDQKLVPKGFKNVLKRLWNFIAFWAGFLGAWGRPRNRRTNICSYTLPVLGSL